MPPGFKPSALSLAVSFSMVLRYHHSNDTEKAEEVKGEEEPEEPQNIVTKIQSIAYWWSEWEQL